MKVWIDYSQFSIIILPFLVFCIALTFLSSENASLAQQECYNDPDSFYDPCDSMAQTDPSLEDGMMDPVIQANGSEDENSQAIEQDDQYDGQQEQANQGGELESGNNGTSSINDIPGYSQGSNEKKLDQSNTLTGSNLSQKAQVGVSNCSNQNDQYDISGNSSNGSLELIFYGRTLINSNPINIQISPNPYTLANTPISIRDNQPRDCNKYPNVISLTHIQFSLYKIKQIDQYGNIIKSFQIPVNKNWPFILVNIQNKIFTTKDLPVFDTIPNQFLVQLNDDVTSSTEEVASSFASKTNAKILKVFQNTRVFVFSINDEDVYKVSDVLSTDSRLRLTEQNIIGKVTQLEGSQSIPTGIKRVISGALQFGLYTNSSIQQHLDADIAILDTGIDLEHPDLNVYRNISFVNGTVSGDDDNGHGSEVAGIAAAKNNMLGVVGMAPGAKLWSIKVCTSSGKCPLSSQIEGIEYAIDHSDEIDVLNVSIENPYSSVLNSSISRAAEKGLIIVVGAGNDAMDASNMSPAGSPDVISVSGLADSDGKCGGLGPVTTYGKDDTFANFSNFGKVIDIASPAVDILTTFNNSDYALDSGTSFAAPHVSGAAALIKSGDKNITADEVKDRLINITSSPISQCDEMARGYFLNDPDTFNEHLLYMNSIMDGNLTLQKPESFLQQAQHVTLDNGPQN
jgi:hypothetical protein